MWLRSATEPWRSIVRVATALEPRHRPADANLLLTLITNKLAVPPPARRTKPPEPSVGKTKRLRTTVVEGAPVTATARISVGQMRGTDSPLPISKTGLFGERGLYP